MNSQPLMTRDSPLVNRESHFPIHDALSTIQALLTSGVSLEIEIGCGKGKFLIDKATQNPGINFLGIDRIAKWMKVGARRSEKRRLENLHFMKAEARQILRDHVPAQSVAAFYIYFPDPWPKRRHRHRRIVNAGLIVLLHGLLRENGRLEIATDDSDYFQSIRKSLSENGVHWRSMNESINQRPGDASLKTNYELKFLLQNKDIYYLELIK